MPCLTRSELGDCTALGPRVARVSTVAAVMTQGAGCALDFEVAPDGSEIRSPVQRTLGFLRLPGRRTIHQAGYAEKRIKWSGAAGRGTRLFVVLKGHNSPDGLWRGARCVEGRHRGNGAGACRAAISSWDTGGTGVGRVRV